MKEEEEEEESTRDARNAIPSWSFQSHKAENKLHQT